MQKNYGIGPGVNIVSLHIVSVYLRLQDDRARKYALHLRYREKLQEDWARAAAAKHAAESSEHARILTPGRLLHEQCDQYKRCGQCKRRTDNCGETNLWKESRYIAGSRLIV